MRTVQLTFGGHVVPPQPPKPRAGAIGKVQRLIEERPWLTCSEIADAVKEPSWRVSKALNRLKHEENAVYEEDLGPSNRMVWASPMSGWNQAGATRLAALRLQKSEQQIAKGLVAKEPDWRPTETIPEDYYAL